MAHREYFGHKLARPTPYSMEIHQCDVIAAYHLLEISKLRCLNGALRDPARTRRPAIEQVD